MESTVESVRVGMVSRAIAIGLAVVATSLIFTSVTLVFTAGAGAGAAASSRYAHASVVQTLPGA